MHRRIPVLSAAGVVAALWCGMALADGVRSTGVAARPGVSPDAAALSPQPLPPKESPPPLKRPGSNKDAVSLSPQPLPPKEAPVAVKRPGLGKDATALSPQPLPPKEAPAKPGR